MKSARKKCLKQFKCRYDISFHFLLSPPTHVASSSSASSSTLSLCWRTNTQLMNSLMRQIETMSSTMKEELLNPVPGIPNSDLSFFPPLSRFRSLSTFLSNFLRESAVSYHGANNFNARNFRMNLLLMVEESALRLNRFRRGETTTER